MKFPFELSHLRFIVLRCNLFLAVLNFPRSQQDNEFHRVNRSSGARTRAEYTRERQFRASGLNNFPEGREGGVDGRQDFTARRFAKILRGRISLGSPGLIQAFRSPIASERARSFRGIISSADRASSLASLSLVEETRVMFDYVRLIIPA